jgi:hypothetical protein
MLTTEQIPAFRAAIDAATDPEFVEYRTNGQTGLMAEWFNQAFTPTHVVWRTNVQQDEIMQNGFDWVRVDNLSVGKARIWEWLFDNQSATFNPSKANVRAGIDECWKGTAADLAVRAAVYVHCKRPATRGEQLYAVGSGTDASPSTMVFEGQITEYDVLAALREV